jgi:peptide/nickel transport system ATP-binding protein
MRETAMKESALNNPPAEASILEIRDLVTHFASVEPGKVVRAVDGVSLTLQPGEMVGLIGESGCGKSTLGRTIVGLAKPKSGQILYRGNDLSQLHGRQLRETRREIQYVFQDPFASMNERQTIGEAISEALEIVGQIAGPDRDRQVLHLLDDVGLPANAAARYARELSGGQRQRAAIARSLAVRPRVLICDEPVSALDLSVRAQVMNLLLDLQKEKGVSCLFIAHDLALVRQAVSRVYVMYLGRIVEEGPSEHVYSRPGHPYVKGLLESVPNPDPRIERSRRPELILGDMPSAVNPPSGCRFRTRCPRAEEECAGAIPVATSAGNGHLVSCRRFPA